MQIGEKVDIAVDIVRMVSIELSRMRLKLPEDKKRVLVCGRIDPTTMAHLASMGAPNMGRAIDHLVEEVQQHKGPQPVSAD